MGLFAYTVAGGALILIGAWESLTSAFDSSSEAQSSPDLPAFASEHVERPSPSSFPSTVTFLSISGLAVAFIANCLVSISDAAGSRDQIGIALQLEVIAAALLFLLYSGLGIFVNSKGAFRSPAYILNVIYVFAFGEEFLLFYKQNKDSSGVENRYYDLLLVPIAICLFSTLLELKSPKSNYPRLGRGIGLVLQGMWTLQMGFSFYSNLMANGCDLHQRSRGNYTVKCKGHMDYHRGRAIATLQFNCHMALLVTVAVGLYSLLCKKNGINKESMRYRPLGVGNGDGIEMLQDGRSQFTLDSDDEDERGEIKESGSGEMQHKPAVAAPNSTVNGHGSHP
ncbi:uncharacterized protein LOC127240706 [Andrographis paniculata]|uniref:uncharacterized protein LOC127240706 n=1 Tax=Andrographis paniculata TaxID=175694 RepID=UPI0021E8425F|nr:uncharacterized protein LOC127240706 [Andrographis paniculata]XP_051115475.1 uncharacterized protein LOC127240706 [Andrographis paniculata]